MVFQSARGSGPPAVGTVCLAVSLLAALVLSLVLPGPFPLWTLPVCLLLSAIAGATMSGPAHRPGGRRSSRRFWATAAVSAALVVLNPMFGLYAFLGYPAAAQSLRGRERAAGTAVIAAVCSLAQTGGPRSPFFSPLLWAAFWAVNLLIAFTMSTEDARRERALDQVRAANEELRLSHARNRALQEQILEQAREAGITEERQRLARELHDTIAQDLVAVIALLGLAADATDEVDRSRRLERAEATARGALAEARRAVGALSSPRLDGDDLPGAVSRLLDALEETFGLAASLSVTGMPRSGANDPVALRIVQESLANASRHAEAGSVHVELDYGPEDLGVRIRDDGTGFAPEARQPGRGLLGMRQRAELAGGRLRIEPGRGEGTRVTAVLPGKWLA